MFCIKKKKMVKMKQVQKKRDKAKNLQLLMLL